MPEINNPHYKVPFKIFQNSYVQTMFAKFFRPAEKIQYTRERIPASEDNFLDLDWSCVSSKSLAIVSDGLESNSERRYVRGAVSALNKNGIDALAVNFRGCSGNQSHEYFLQYGETDDLNTIINHVLNTTRYENIYLVGCSVGGNLIMEYLGEKSSELDPRIKKAFAVSATLDLESSCDMLHIKKNWLYLKAFLLMLFLRVWQMRKTFNPEVKFKEFFYIKTFTDFYYYFVYQQKEVFLNEYFEVNSSQDSLNKITIPSCLLYSKDDPFLDHQFFPYREADSNPNIFLVMTEYGGHVGFVDFDGEYYFSEKLMISFLTKEISYKDSNNPKVAH